MLDEYAHDDHRDSSMNKKVNNILGSTDKGFYELKRVNKHRQIKKVGCFITGFIHSECYYMCI